MKVLLLVAIGLVVLVGAVAAIGWLLPVSHVAARTATFPKPAPEVYATIADVAGYPHWWDELERVEILPSASGRVRFREHTSSGPVVMEIAEASPPTRLVTRIDDPDQPFGGTWTFEITPAGEQTRLTITERGEIYNPIFRFLSRFVFGYSGTMDGFLQALGRRFGSAAV